MRLASDPGGDTIVAIATPAGRGALAVVRVSGPAALPMVDDSFRGRTGLADAPSRYAAYGRLLDSSGDTVDDVVATPFRRPNSYTGEDMVEISCHGSPVVAARVVELLTSAGARGAEPGEFTRRAFLNGKLDLAQAEAVVEVIESSSTAALRGARNRLDGELGRHVESLRDRLLEVAGLTELDLDFAAEEVPIVPAAELAERTGAIVGEIEEMLAGFRIGRLLHDGVQVALVGPPNVGKSSLLNRLARETRALVSEVPGTTRDSLHADIEVDGVYLRLTDTAGLRSSTDHVEQLGMERTRQIIRDADLVVALVSCDTARSGLDATEMAAALRDVAQSRLVRVANKADLGPPPDDVATAVSALTGAGVPALARLLVERGLGVSGYTERSSVVASVRQRDALEAAKAQLRAAQKLASRGEGGELVAAELRAAVRNLEEIVGLVTDDDVLNAVFARFCIGK